MLAQLSSVKSRIGLESFAPDDDALLTNLLKAVSARFEAECNRIFDYGEGLTYEFRADQVSIIVDHPPILSVTSFELKTSEAEGWIIQADVAYLLSPLKSVIELDQPLGTNRQLGRATYSGGFILPGATPTGNQRPLPDAIEQACIEQVAYWYQRRSQLGLVSVSSGDSTVQQYGSSDLLPQVKAVLKQYQRWIL